MRSRLRTSAVLGMLLVSALPACGASEEAPRTPGLSAADRAKLPVLPTAPAAAPAPAAKEAPAFADLPGALAPSDPQAQGAAPAGAAPAIAGNDPAAPGAAVEKKRDLSAELQALLGQPTDCLDLQKVVDDGGKIKVRVGAYVGPSGRITRATVNAPGQPAQALNCLERRAVALKMQDPIEDAPRLVEAELSFEIARTQVPAAPAPPAPAPSPPPVY